MTYWLARLVTTGTGMPVIITYLLVRLFTTGADMPVI